MDGDETVHLKRQDDPVLKDILAQLQVIGAQSFRKQCPDHGALADDVTYIKKNQDIIGVDFKEAKAVLEDLKSGQSAFRAEIRSISNTQNGLRATTYGAEGTGGLTGWMNWIKGGIAVMSILTTVACVGIWKLVDKIGAVHDEVTAHSSMSAHPVMEERYDELRKLFDSHRGEFTHAQPEALDGIHREMHERMDGE